VAVVPAARIWPSLLEQVEDVPAVRPRVLADVGSRVSVSRAVVFLLQYNWLRRLG
jgi:hypothetical protein